MMHTPSFWYPKGTIQPNEQRWIRALSPLSWIYAAGRALHVALTRPALSPLPTICIGNLVAGGGGKTPTAIAIAQLLKQNRTWFLTRGYGGQTKGPTPLTDPKNADLIETGDEAQLLSAIAPTMISKNRLKGAQAIRESGGNLIIMDDGLQSRHLQAQINLLLIDGKTGLGNGHMIPAGPLREPLHKALARVDAIIRIGPDHHEVDREIPRSLPLFTAQITADFNGLDPAAPYVAFAGIARPEKFFETLKDAGLNVVETILWPDHHVPTQMDLTHLRQLASRANARLVTTEKDFTRLPEEFRTGQQVLTLPISLAFDDPERLKGFLEERLKGTDIGKDPLSLPHRIEGMLITGLMHLFAALGVDRASAFGGWIGRKLGPLTGIHRKAGRQLGEICPEMSESEIEKTLIEMWDNLGRSMAEYPHLEQIARERIEVEDRAQLDEKDLKSGPSLFIAGHFANWEIAGPALLERFGIPLHLIYRAPNNPVVDELLGRYRSLSGKLPTLRKSREGTRQIVKTMKEGGAIGLLIDQKYNEGIAALFFGKPAMSTSAYAQLGQKFNCPVYPAQTIRTGGAHFKIIVHPPLRLFETDGKPRPQKDIVADAHTLMEKWMREHPEQWLWVHQRWSSKRLQEA